MTYKSKLIFFGSVLCKKKLIVEQYNEIINFTISLLLFLVFYFVIRRAKILFPQNFLFAFIAFFSALMFTILETYFFPELLNVLEHFFYFLTAVFFFLTIRNMNNKVLK